DTKNDNPAERQTNPSQALGSQNPAESQTPSQALGSHNLAESQTDPSQTLAGQGQNPAKSQDQNFAESQTDGQNPAKSQTDPSQSLGSQGQNPAESQTDPSQNPAESRTDLSQTPASTQTQTRQLPERPSQSTAPAASQAPPAKTAAQPKKLLPSSKAKPASGDKDDEYDPGEEDVPPPEQVSKATLMKRLARLCTPREDGTFKIPQEVIDTYKNIRTRDEVYRSFEKCGCVVFSKRINRKYEEINEKSVETEFEFLTEQEMEDKGWSEKSEYCDDYMYWVAVRVKGSNKKTKRNTATEILEGEDQESMQDADEAMDQFPFNLDGDGGAVPTG
ncbi:unnamed protein product, partial [Symbiodinium necroappetens]